MTVLILIKGVHKSTSGKGYCILNYLRLFLLSVIYVKIIKWMIFIWSNKQIYLRSIIHINILSNILQIYILWICLVCGTTFFIYHTFLNGFPKFIQLTISSYFLWLFSNKQREIFWVSEFLNNSKNDLIFWCFDGHKCFERSILRAVRLAFNFKLN